MYLKNKRNIMKITLSRIQWEEIGKKKWMDKESTRRGRKL
jgi:hypothetical protein